MRGDVNDEPPAATTQILLGPPVRRSARQASSATGAMPGGCGTSLRLIPRGALLQPPLPCAASWPTTSWSATPSSTASSTSTPAPANRPRSPKTRPTAATKPPQITLRFGRESTWADCEAAVSTLADHASDSRGAGFQNGRRIECGPYRESVTPARTGTSVIASGRAAVRTMKWTRTFFRTSFGNQLWLKDLESTEAEATVRRPGPPEGGLPLYDGLAGRVD